MKIVVKKSSKQEEIQEQFNSRYPFLKIEFLKSIVRFANGASVKIDKNRTVTQLEKDFKESTGITIQVFRRSGNVWVKTGLTDDWTLERQNEEGEQISSHFSGNMSIDRQRSIRKIP
jgi:hypothetical protein